MKKGFTLTELAVAIAFISILLLTIATVTLNMVQSYHKGTTMKEINTVGLELISEFSDAISESSKFSYESYCSIFTEDKAREDCKNDKGQKFIFQEGAEGIKIKNTDKTVSNAQKYGIFCTGKYTYIWNTGYTMNSTDGIHTKSSDLYVGVDEHGNDYVIPALKIYRSEKVDGNYTTDAARLRKYQDPTRSICVKMFSDTDENKSYNSGNFARITNDASVAEMIIADELITTQDLAIFSLKVDQPVIEPASQNALYSIHLVLGSVSGGIEFNGDNPSCNMQNASSYDTEYCATNKFNFTVRSNGNSNV